MFCCDWGKKNKADESFKARENIPKVILTHSKSCSAGTDSVNDKGVQECDATEAP